MEIKDYLKVLGKRAWLLVMIPAVAGVVAGLIAVRQPQAFRTTATLQLPRDASTTPALIAQKVADFRAAASNPAVQGTVSQATGVPVKKIEKLQIGQVGDSSQLTLTLVDKKSAPTDAKAVVQGVAGAALNYLQAPQVQAGQRAVETANDKINEAQTNLAKANSDLQAKYTSIQSSTPDDDIKQLRTEITDAKGRLAEAQIQANTVAQATYQQIIETDQLHLLALLQSTSQISIIQGNITEAQAALKTATDERDVATKQLDAATVPLDLTFSTEGQAVVRKTRVVKTAAAAVVAGFPIAIGLVLLLDAAQRRRRQRALEDGEEADRDDLEDHDEEAAAQQAVLVPTKAARQAESLNGVHEAKLVATGEPAVLLASRTSKQTAFAPEDENDDYDDDFDDEDDDLVEEPDRHEAADEDEDDFDDLDEDDEDDDAAEPADAESQSEEPVQVADGDAKDEEDEADEATTEPVEEAVPATSNGRRRRGRPARVPAADVAFEGDDEGPEADR